LAPPPAPRQSLDLLVPSYREHVMLLCTDQEDCDSAEVEVISNALKAGQLCVYASVLNEGRSHLSKISSNISNFNQHTKNGDLLIIDFNPFAESALHSDLTPFIELKERIEQTIAERIRTGKSDKVLLFAEAAGKLANNHHFEESIDLEKWWNGVHRDWLRKGLNVTIICPHAYSTLSAESTHNVRNNISHVHTLTLELEKLRKRKQLAKEIRVLIVEPEADIRILYRRYFDKLGAIQAFVMATAKEALQSMLSASNRRFDLIILDTHLKDGAAIEIARQIISRIPDQRIAFTTTTTTSQIIDDITSIGFDSQDVLVKPFSFRDLISFIKAGEGKAEKFSC
jgi:CheY-like chemotaxis protein